MIQQPEYLPGISVAVGDPKQRLFLGIREVRKKRKWTRKVFCRVHWEKKSWAQGMVQWSP